MGQMKQHDLTKKLQEQYVKEVTGEKPKRTLEDALQEALDNTTPEFPGAPKGHSTALEEQEDAEWL